MRYAPGSRNLYALVAILAGLSATQLLGAIQVYFSNRGLHRSMQMVQEAGYLPVPNAHVWGSLQGSGTAFLGGIFFTLTVGTGLSVAALVFAWTWDRLFKRGKAALLLFLLLWLLGIIAINAGGFSLPATAYCFFVPPVVFLTAILLLPEKPAEGPRLYRLAYLGVPVLPILLFLPLEERSIFIDIRDTVLLGNPVGRKINDFYYNYTLFAAQAFKSLEQKSIRTCRLFLAHNESHRIPIETIFLSHDYLVVDGEGPVDLSVMEQDDRLLFLNRGREVLTTTLRGFTADPSTALQQFSQKTDRSGPLRLLAFLSLVIGAPLCLYIMGHGLFFLIFALFMDRRKSAYGALLACFLAGMAIALPLYGLRTQTVSRQNLPAALASPDRQERLAALRYIAENGMAADQLIVRAPDILSSPDIAERYWYVRALGSSGNPAAISILLSALDDPHINVVCMAFYGLGQQGDPAVINEILRRMKKSGKWYEQWYGYRALRTLGWRQQR